MINVLLAEDHTIVRDGIRLLLETDPNIHIVAEARNGDEVLEKLGTETKVDIILTDLQMPGMDGHEVIAAIRARYSRIPVIVLSMMDTDMHVSKAFENGACGYLLKNIGAEELIYGVKHVFNGGKYISADLSQSFFEKARNVFKEGRAQQSLISFSTREIEILSLIGEGLTNSEMSEKLFLSKRTIEGHRQTLIDKTGSRNTAALVKYAVLNGVIK